MYKNPFMVVVAFILIGMEEKSNDDMLKFNRFRIQKIRQKWLKLRTKVDLAKT